MGIGISYNPLKGMSIGSFEFKGADLGSNPLWRNKPEPLVYYTDSSEFAFTVPNGYTSCSWQSMSGESRWLTITRSGNVIFDGEIMSSVGDEFVITDGDELNFRTGDMHILLDLEIKLT